MRKRKNGNNILKEKHTCIRLGQNHPLGLLSRPPFFGRMGRNTSHRPVSSRPPFFFFFSLGAGAWAPLAGRPLPDAAAHNELRF
jgi:hypothetical protein